MASFDILIESVFDNEDANWRTNPQTIADNDGGTVRFGINSNSVSVSGYAVKSNENALAVSKLTAEQAKDIIRKNFWKATWEKLSDELAYELLDWSVTSGMTYPTLTAQALANVSQGKTVATVDGIWGSQSDALAANGVLEPLLRQFRQARWQFYRNIAVGANAIYLDGWQRRVGEPRGMDAETAAKFNEMVSKAKPALADKLRMEAGESVTAIIPIEPEPDNTKLYIGLALGVTALICAGIYTRNRREPDGYN